MRSMVQKTITAGLCIGVLLSIPSNIESLRWHNIVLSGTIIFAFLLSIFCVLYLVYWIVRPSGTSNDETLRKNMELELLLVEKDLELTELREQLKNELVAYKEAEIRSRAIRAELKSLSARLESVREEERTRISREIHDELGQQLTGLKMDISWINKRMSEQPEMSEKLRSMLGLVDTTLRTVRKISTELRPGILDDLGLIPAIEWQCSECEKRNGIECHFHNHSEEQEFSPELSTAVFRIVQEALTNVVRHSNATSIVVDMKSQDDSLMVSIKDNGKGISPEDISNTKTLGLLGIKERAELLGGDCRIDGKKGEGTTITLVIPQAA